MVRAAYAACAACAATLAYQERVGLRGESGSVSANVSVRTYYPPSPSAGCQSLRRRAPTDHTARPAFVDELDHLRLRCGRLEVRSGRADAYLFIAAV